MNSLSLILLSQHDIINQSRRSDPRGHRYEHSISHPFLLDLSAQFLRRHRVRHAQIIQLEPRFLSQSLLPLTPRGNRYIDPVDLEELLDVGLGGRQRGLGADPIALFELEGVHESARLLHRVVQNVRVAVQNPRVRFFVRRQRLVLEVQRRDGRQAALQLEVLDQSRGEERAGLLGEGHGVLVELRGAGLQAG